MTILAMTASGVAAVADALRSGQAVVVPFPSPLPYGVAATTVAAVNEAKGRPRAQPCGVLVADPGDVRPYLDLDEDTAELAVRLGELELMNLFLPVRNEAPNWLSASAVGGVVGVTFAWLDETRPLADEFGHLFVSSGNRTAGPVAVTAGDADAIFGGKRLVLDGDPLRDTTRPNGSATIVEVLRHGRLRVVRDGVNNHGYGTDHEAYLDDLRRRHHASR